MFKKNLLIILIVILGAFFRLIWSNQVPPSLNWDEVSLGYNAYSILKTGHDEWGRFLPLTFEAFGDYKLPGYIYTLVPFVATFGLQDWVVRLPSEVAGIASILLIYLVVLKLGGKKSWALFSALLIAISPWHIFFSRVALEGNLALFYFLLGLNLFLVGLQKKWLLSLSALFFAVTIFTYNSARIFVPLFLIVLALLYFKELIKDKKSLILPFLVLAFFTGIAGFLAITVDSSSRYYWVSIVDQGAINYLNESRGTSQLGFLTPFVFNRYVYFLVKFTQNYLMHFSPEFLFLKGGTQYQFSLPNFGLIYLVELPFLIIGIIQLFKKNRNYLLILSWVLLGPIASAITREAPHVLRSIFFLASLPIIVGFGLDYSWNYLKSNKLIFKLFPSIVTICLMLSLTLFSYQYFIGYAKTYSYSWQYGNKQVVEYLNNSPEVVGKQIYFSKRYGEPHIFYLFYSQYDPQKYQTNPTLVRYSQTNWRWVDKLDNINFVDDWKIKQDTLEVKNAILVTTQGNYPDNAKVLKTINFLDGSIAYEIVEI